MNSKSHTYISLLSVLILALGCSDNTSTKLDVTLEKEAILKVINDETKAAFNRDYPAWKKCWIQKDYVSKTYMNFADTTMTETLGWKEIDDFVRTYIETHPEPAPLPTLVDKIQVRLYGNGAWVDFEQDDAERGFKRETRLMEKENGQWKIAGMQTVIYGFRSKEK